MRMATSLSAGRVNSSVRRFPDGSFRFVFSAQDTPPNVDEVVAAIGEFSDAVDDLHSRHREAVVRTWGEKAPTPPAVAADGVWVVDDHGISGELPVRVYKIANGLYLPQWSAGGAIHERIHEAANDPTNSIGGPYTVLDQYISDWDGPFVYLEKDAGERHNKELAGFFDAVLRGEISLGEGSAKSTGRHAYDLNL
jgi:hypothetical protein